MALYFCIRPAKTEDWHVSDRPCNVRYEVLGDCGITGKTVVCSTVREPVIAQRHNEDKPVEGCIFLHDLCSMLSGADIRANLPAVYYLLRREMARIDVVNFDDALDMAGGRPA